MTTTRALAELFRSIAARDFDGAAAVALRICEAEERNGHRAVARQLRGALRARPEENIVGPDHSIAAIAPIQGAFSTALVRLNEVRTFDDIALSKSIRSVLDGVILEWRHRDKLDAVGIAPRSKLLFHGPPGCGKSLTAQVLGRELNLPVYMVRFDAVIGAFLGQTAIHIRQLFHFAETSPCVLLLDELDALGKRRGSPLDVGELDRIVISLLQELEHSKPIGVVIATTNLAKHLDEALWRRFDLEVHFRAPNQRELRQFVHRLASSKGVSPVGVMRSALAAKSFADAERIVLNQVRRKALVE